jgi:hypothetical protein
MKIRNPIMMGAAALLLGASAAVMADGDAAATT